MKTAQEAYDQVVHWHSRVLAALEERRFTKVVFDLETNIQRKGSPFWPSNKIVSGVVKIENQPADYRRPFHPEGMFEAEGLTVLVGANIKFDLLWLRREFPEAWDWIAGGKQVIVWDVLLAEYILSAQMRTINNGNLSLDALSQKYGLGGKVSVVSELIKKGVDPEDMDADLLEEYTIKDANDPCEIFERQWEQAKQKGMLRNILTQNEALLATTEMEWNGLVMDRDKLDQMGKQCREQMDSLQTQMTEIVSKMILPLDVLDLDCTEGQMKSNTVLWNSAQRLAGFLFGGHPSLSPEVCLKGSVKQCVGEYKTGKNKGEKKYAKEKVELRVCAVGHKLPLSAIPPKGAKGYPSTGADELSKLILLHGDKLPEQVKLFLSLLADYRKAAKMLSTYCEGLVEQLWPDGKLHGNLIHYSTATGRLSSSAPNLQNIDTRLKEIFVAREKHGWILSCDYSQLEVVVQGELTQDENLCRDIEAGVDFHVKRLAYTVPETYEEIIEYLKRDENDNFVYASGPEWHGKRKKAKTVSFQRAYGAGAYTCAEASGLTLEQVQTIFKQEEHEYANVAQWAKEKLDEAKNQYIRNTHEIKLSDGRVVKAGTGITVSIDGYRFHYPETEAPDFAKSRGLTSIKPTIIKNYETQGFAGRSIVNSTMGVLFRCISWAKWPVLLLNNVHDNILSEVVAEDKKVLDFCVEQVQSVMQDTERLGKIIGHKFRLPLKVDPQLEKHWKKE